MIGVDISDRSIKIVEVTQEDIPRIKTMCWGPLAEELMQRGIVQDIALVIEAVRQTMEKCSPGSLTGENVVASIPETQSFVQVLDVPAMLDEEVDEAIQWVVRKHFPFDPENVYIDWEAVGEYNKQSGMRRVLVGAAQKTVVDPLLAVLDGLDFHVLALELEVQAISRCLLPRKYEDAQNVGGVLILDLGATLTNIVFFDEGIMRFSRSLPHGGDELTGALSRKLNIDPLVAIEKKAEIGTLGRAGNDQEIAQILRDAASEWATVLREAAREMLVQLPGEPHVRTILLSGGSANLPGIEAVFSQVFNGLPVQLGNVWTNLRKNASDVSVSNHDALHFTTAIGLALRLPEVGS